MIRLTESTYVSCFACTESILLCGDIHPHPGPNNPERLSIGTNVDSGKLMPARITYSARQLLSFNFQHGAHIIGDLALACIQRAGILRGSTNHIVTPSRIQVHVIESCLRRSPRRLNHANLTNCINLSPMADYAKAAFALLFHPASPSKGGLIWSHQIMNACGCGFALRACLVHSLATSLVLCTSLKHLLTYNGLVLAISSSVLTMLSPLTLTAG